MPQGLLTTWHIKKNTVQSVCTGAPARWKLDTCLHLHKAHSDSPCQWETQLRPLKKKLHYNSSELSDGSFTVLCKLFYCWGVLLVTTANGNTWKSLLRFIVFLLPPWSQHFWELEVQNGFSGVLSLCQSFKLKQKWHKPEVMHYRDAEFSKNFQHQIWGHFMTETMPGKAKFL